MKAESGVREKVEATCIAALSTRGSKLTGQGLESTACVDESGCLSY